MLKKTVFVSLLTFLMLGCSATLPPKDTTVKEPALALFKISASGTFFSGLGVSVFGDESLSLLLKNDETGAVYTCQVWRENYCAAANIPVGKYTVEDAISPFKKPIIGTPIKVLFKDKVIHASISEAGVNYIGSYVIKTRQDGFSLIVESLHYSVPSDSDRVELEKLINGDNSESGWHFGK